MLAGRYPPKISHAEIECDDKNKHEELICDKNPDERNPYKCDRVIFKKHDRENRNYDVEHCRPTPPPAREAGQDRQKDDSDHNKARTFGEERTEERIGEDHDDRSRKEKFADDVPVIRLERHGFILSYRKDGPTIKILTVLSAWDKKKSSRALADMAASRARREG
jgi:hypothetical protein